MSNYSNQFPTFKIRQDFTVGEITCKCGCGLCNVDEDAMSRLQILRNVIGWPIVINSACRCRTHNANVGGVPNSFHVSSEGRESRAFDICIKSDEKSTRESVNFLAGQAKRVGFTGILIYDTFVHVDTRPTPYYEDKRRG